MKNNIRDFFNCNIKEVVQYPPDNPKSNTNYFISSQTNPISNLLLLLSKPSAHSDYFKYGSKRFVVRIRKYKGVYICPHEDCHYTTSTSSNTKMCPHPLKPLNQYGENCPFRIYILNPEDQSSEQLIMMTTGLHNHKYYPREWGIKDKSKIEIDNALKRNPFIKKSDFNAPPQNALFNKVKFEQVLIKRRKKLFGDEQSEWALKKLRNKIWKVTL